MKYQGILPDDLHTPEFVRECEDHERQRERERAREAEAEQYASECQRIYDELEAMFLPHLREDAAAVNATARIKPGDKKIFDEFKEYLSSWNPPLPALPAHPASVAAFLAKDLDRAPRSSRNVYARSRACTLLRDYRTPLRTCSCSHLSGKFEL